VDAAEVDDAGSVSIGELAEAAIDELSPRS
jgi:hypothetical protein